MVLKTMGKLPLEVAKHPVGLDSMVQELGRYISAQSERKVQIVGIVGVEGVGKTTLGKELYNQKCSSFRHTSFIFNVRDAASQRVIHKKQKKLLMDIGFKNQDSFFDNIEEGKTILGSHLKSLSVLIVLDDVSHGDQLDALLPKSARDRLGSPSLIIVTSRELRVLTKWGIPSNGIHKMKGLDESDAEHLLCKHAFLQTHPKEGYEDLVREYLIECRGLPLSLEEHGEEIYRKSMDDIEWERKLPPHYHKILSRAVPHKRYWFKEDIYDALCNSIQIEEGKQIIELCMSNPIFLYLFFLVLNRLLFIWLFRTIQSIWLDQSTGKIGLKTSARSLTIKHGDDDRYWQWVSTDESRFGQVKELIEVWFFHVYHRFECTLLSPNTEYTVAFVVKIDQSRVHSHQSPFEFRLQTIEGNLIQSARFLDDLERPVSSHGEFSMTPLINAEDGWMEFVVGEFFLKEDDGSRQARVVDVFMKNQNCDFPKSGIFLDGLKITPKTIKMSGEQVYKKSMDESAVHMGNDCPTSKVATGLKKTSMMRFAIQFRSKRGSSIWLDQSTGKIGLKTSARSLTIEHGDDDRYWQWVSTDESRFGQVKELIEVWFFHVYHRFECTLLSPNTKYTVAFVVKIDQSRVHSHQSPFEFCLRTIEENLIQSARFLDDLDKSVESHGEFSMTPLINAEDGWMEFVVGEFFLKEDDGSKQARVVDVFMKNHNCNFPKSGIFLDGLKITPKTINKSGEQVYKKSMDETAAHMGNDCPTSKVAKIANSYASASDIKWKTKLPPNYQKILSRAVIQKDYSSMEEIYFALCNSIEVEKGKQIVWLDKWTGKIGLKASASSMATTHCNDIEKWRWVPTEESSFGQVKELVQEWYSKVYARIECTLLSPNTEYTVALVVKIDKSRMHSHQSPFEFSLKTIEGNLIQSARFLDDLEKPVESHGGFNKTPLKYAENGWMEFVVGEFFLKEDDGNGRAKVIDVLMKNENSNFRKSGIFLDGVKITPK